eukprot:CAMPEP_0113303206 /NCGR_PEP_ID=MMETSP0010_2-20120614/3722_1 /TAXON_ID=216773 ORGANISM="Corethron hystrix, Strain 308" /NCGR_SAMPLE_ID=MMETSP0010_2 /ASSEMBLY_ACC=CAM_ASM_000155 /LENGTH=399 /DNA_ID=CAMNT_0000157171 /DNA_START=336 /DNA_END=1533 /DNA_ORIENTATION=+ /assembly_acc=CAM_ASM_000155
MSSIPNNLTILRRTRIGLYRLRKSKPFQLRFVKQNNFEHNRITPKRQFVTDISLLARKEIDGDEDPISHPLEPKSENIEEFRRNIELLCLDDLEYEEGLHEEDLCNSRSDKTFYKDRDAVGNCELTSLSRTGNRQDLIQRTYASGIELHKLRTEREKIKKKIVEHLLPNGKYGEALLLDRFVDKLDCKRNTGSNGNYLYGLDPERVRYEAICNMHMAAYGGRIDYLNIGQKINTGAEYHDGELTDYWKSVAMDAESHLRQYNLHGLWVGKSGEGGYEMINITYSGDMLYAYEVSHTQSRREIFRADLCPKYDQHGIREDALLPIELTPATSTAWGTASLERFHGVSSVVPCYSGIKSNGDLFHKFKNTFRGSGAFSKSGEGKEVKGQLIVIGDYISFLW